MKTLVKMTSIIAIIAACSWGAAWTGTKTQPGTTTVDGKTYYKITTAEHLAWFAQKVNDGSTSINGLLANDINFGTSTTTASSTNWLKIGNNSSHQFKGIFDGQNHTVYGIKLGNASEIGFFGYIGMLLGIFANEYMDATIGHETIDTGLFKATMFLNPTVGLDVCIEATLVMIIAGTIAGLIPAYKASRIRPIEALRAD